MKNRRLSYSLDSMIAAVPLIVWCAAVSGTRTLFLAAAAVTACVISDLALSLAMREKPHLSDLTAVSAGLTLTLFFPVTAAVYEIVFAAAIAIIVLRILNLYSPVRLPPLLFGALAAWLVFGMPEFVPYGEKIAFSLSGYGGELLREVPEMAQIAADGLPDTGIVQLLFGGRTGLAGEAAFLLVISFVWLCVRKHRLPGAPLVFLGVSFALFYVFPDVAIESDIISLQHGVTMLLCAPYMMTAAFVIGDPAVLPHSQTGRVAAGAAGAAVAFLFSSYVSKWLAPFAGALAMSLLAYPLDLIFCRNTVFGGTYAPPRPSDGGTAKNEAVPEESSGTAEIPTGTDISENIVEQRDDGTDGGNDAGADQKASDAEGFSVLDKFD